MKSTSSRCRSVSPSMPTDALLRGEIASGVFEKANLAIKAEIEKRLRLIPNVR